MVLLVAGCPEQEAGSDEINPGAPAALDSSSTQDDTGSEEDQPALTADTPPPPTKQLVLIYSGDTLAKVDAEVRELPVRGGLPALAATITNYEGMITEYNRRRIVNEGGDAEHIKTDLEQGFLGEHPFMLLDYGGWTRPNDFAGAPYVELYMQMFLALKYTAVGSKLYDLLPPERWKAYIERAPEGFTMLASAGDPQGETLPVVRVVSREVHGSKWGVVCVPLPRPFEVDAVEGTRVYIEQAADELAAANCEYSILLLSEAPSAVYRKLKGDPRFTVVIGAPGHLAVPEGYGNVPASGAIILPTVDAGARSIGTCHVYYSDTGSEPLMYNFSAKTCDEDFSLPFPFRKQVEEAKAEHDQLVAEYPSSIE